MHDITMEELAFMGWAAAFSNFVEGEYEKALNCEVLIGIKARNFSITYHACINVIIATNAALENFQDTIRTLHTMKTASLLSYA